jgi:hypothetical protein
MDRDFSAHRSVYRDLPTHTGIGKLLTLDLSPPFAHICDALGLAGRSD